MIVKKKRTCRIVEFVVPADNRVKIKENEKEIKYLDLARELKMKMSVILFTNPSARAGYDTRSIFKRS